MLTIIGSRSPFAIVFAGNGDSEIGRTSFLSPVMINTGTTGKLNRSTVPPRSSTNSAIFTQFSFEHRINPKEILLKNGKESVYFIIFKDNFTFSRAILQNSRTIPGQMDFSRSVRTLYYFSGHWLQ